MKRSLILLLLVGLLAGSVATAEAKKKKKKKPTRVTLYLHGQETLGEVDMGNNFGAGYFKMDATEPTDPAPKSVTPPAWSGTPWNDCAGMYILPVWTGGVSGKIVGDMTVTLHAASAPRPVEIQIWADVGSQTCASNDLSEGQFPEPVASTIVDSPAGVGTIEATFEDVDFQAIGMLMMQIRPVGGPFPGRILYDGADHASAIEFSCIPNSGKSCV